MLIFLLCTYIKTFFSSKLLSVAFYASTFQLRHSGRSCNVIEKIKTPNSANEETMHGDGPINCDQKRQTYFFSPVVLTAPEEKRAMVVVGQGMEPFEVRRSRVKQI